MASKDSTDYFRKGFEFGFKGGSELTQKESWREREEHGGRIGRSVQQAVETQDKGVNRYTKHGEVEEILEPSKRL